MSILILPAALWVAALSAGLMAGVYYAFSSFIMRALAERPSEEGMAAMQSVNRVILRSSFLPLFVLSSGLCLILAVWAVWSWGTPPALPTLAGSLSYLLGMLGCTALFNVPLNERLDQVAPGDGTGLWPTYLRTWTRFNHLRTAASLAACILFVAALRLQ